MSMNLCERRRGLIRGAAWILGASVLAATGAALAQKPLPDPRSILPRATDRHAIIAITCPYAPYFGLGNDSGTEWALIASALRKADREPKYLYVDYDEGVRYAESNYVAGIWICGGMRWPKNGFFPSTPLLKRNFVVITREAAELEIARLEDLSGITVAAHPDVLRVLSPQLESMPKESTEIRGVANHALLASLLTTGQIDALITEKSVFQESLKRVPEDADPTQPLTFHEIFAPVSPVILFKEEDLRDRFDAAWKAITDGGGGQYSEEG